MNAALAQSAAQTQAMPADLLNLPDDNTGETVDDTTEILGQAVAAAEAEVKAGTALPEANPAAKKEVRLGFEQLRTMNHDELRGVIAKRVHMLETVLREREERRAALDTARLASRMLDIRRERAVRIQKRVNFGSAVAALASTMLIVAVMV